MRLTKILWPIIIVCSALAAIMAMRVFPSLSIRPLFIMWFLFICPGMALVRFLRLKELVVKLTLAVALSFSIDGIVVGIYLYAGHWAPFAIMLSLTVPTIAAVVVEVTNLHILVYKHVGFIRSFGALLTNPLILGTSSVKPQSINTQDVVGGSNVRAAQANAIANLFANGASADIEEKPTMLLAKAPLSAAAREVDIEEKPTMQMAKSPLSASAREVDIEEKPTVQMAKSSFMAAAREADIEEKPTMQMAKSPLAAAAKDVDIEEKPTVQMAKSPLLAAAREADIEEKPTMQMANSPLSTAGRDADADVKPIVPKTKAPLSAEARERFENQSTVQMPAQFSPAQQRAIWPPNEPPIMPAKDGGREENVDDEDDKQKTDPRVARVPAMPKIAPKDVDKAVPASEPRATVENHLPEGADLEKRATVPMTDGGPSKPSNVDNPDTQKLDDPDTQRLDDPDTQKLFEGNINSNTQMLVDGEVLG